MKAHDCLHSGEGFLWVFFTFGVLLIPAAMQRKRMKAHYRLLTSAAQLVEAVRAMHRRATPRRERHVNCMHADV